MPNARCDACKHWDLAAVSQYDWEGESVGFGLCRAVRTRWDIQDEDAGPRVRIPDQDEAFEALVQQRREALRKSRAYVQDGSEYRAELITAPDFFCALFQEK